MNSANDEDPHSDSAGPTQSNRFLFTSANERTNTVFINSNLDESKIFIAEPKDYKQAISQYLRQQSSVKLQALEKKLYKINKMYHKLAPGPVRLSDLILTFPKMEYGILPQDPHLQINPEKIFNENPNLSIKFKILTQVIDLVSGLSAKWKIFKSHKFLYRYNSRINFTKVLNLEKINSCCYNIDTFWFCIAVRCGLIEEIENVEIKQASLILMEQFDEVLGMILDERVEKVGGAGGTGKVEEIKKKKSLCGLCFRRRKYEARYSVSLDLPNFVWRLVKKNKDLFATKIYKTINDLDYCYRYFEKALFGRFINVSHNAE